MVDISSLLKYQHSLTMQKTKSFIVILFEYPLFNIIAEELALFFAILPVNGNIY